LFLERIQILSRFDLKSSAPVAGSPGKLTRG